MYDEIETFRDYDSDLFHYPYGPRKTNLNSLTLNSNLWQWTEDGLDVTLEYNYEYFSTDIKL